MTNQPAEMLNALGIERTEDNYAQLDELHRIMKLYAHRSEVYGQLWKQYGALNNLVRAATKVDRLMAAWWSGDGEVPALHKSNLDDALDAVNYLLFFIRCAQEGNIIGTPPLRPEKRSFLEAISDLISSLSPKPYIFGAEGPPPPAWFMKPGPAIVLGEEAEFAEVDGPECDEGEKVDGYEAAVEEERQPPTLVVEFADGALRTFKLDVSRNDLDSSGCWYWSSDGKEVPTLVIKPGVKQMGKPRKRIEIPAQCIRMVEVQPTGERFSLSA